MTSDEEYRNDPLAYDRDYERELRRLNRKKLAMAEQVLGEIRQVIHAKKERLLLNPERALIVADWGADELKIYYALERYYQAFGGED